MGQKNPKVLKACLNTGYTTTNTYADIATANSALLVKILEDGYYDIFAQASVNQDGAGDATNLRIAVNGLGITGSDIYGAIAGAVANGITPYHLTVAGIYLKKDDQVTVQAQYQNTSTVVYYSGGVSVPSLTVARR